MKVIVSPAKKLDFETEIPLDKATEPALLKKGQKLAKHMKTLSAAELSKLMSLSQNLAQLNFERYQSFKTSKKLPLAKPAGYAFNGDTYTGLDFKTLSAKEVKTAQSKLRILSGLYGILRPLDLIQPYRLEMGTRLKFNNTKNLYEFWGDDITEELNKELKKSDVLVNCASQEYFSAVNVEKLNCRIITPVFKENKNGALKVISFNAKRARGMMARFIIQNDLKKPEELKKFSEDGYEFSYDLSNENEFVFIR